MTHPSIKNITFEPTGGSVRITQTAIGMEYRWDFVSDVNWVMLKHNLKCAEHVLENPAKYPKADMAKVAQRIADHREFLMLHGGVVI